MRRMPTAEFDAIDLLLTMDAPVERADLAIRMDLSETAADARMRRLAKRGLVDVIAHGYHAPPTYQPSPAGIAAYRGELSRMDGEHPGELGAWSVARAALCVMLLPAYVGVTCEVPG